MGRFQLGQRKPAGSGRRKGIPNKRTQFLGEVLDRLRFEPVEKILELLPSLPPERQVEVLMDLVPFLYAKPTPVKELSAVENEPRRLRADDLTEEERMREIQEMTGRSRSLKKTSPAAMESHA